MRNRAPDREVRSVRLLARFVAFVLCLTVLPCLCAFARVDGRAPRVRSAAGGTHAYGTIVFRVKVPHAPAPAGVPGARHLRPQYLSLSTQSLALLMDGKNALVSDVDPLGYVVLSLNAPVGRHIFTVTAYDRRGARGNVLSTGTTAPVTIWANGRISVNLTLDGVVASVSLMVAQTHTTIGTPATMDLVVVARDPDGNTIVNGTTFTRPFTLTSSDPLNGKFSQTVVTSLPQYFPRLTVTYSGANVAKIVLSATGADLKSVTPVVLLPVVKPRSPEQIIVSGGALSAAFSPAAGHQLLATFGLSDGPAASAVDTADRLIYESYFDTTTCCFSIYQTYGAHALVDRFDPHLIPTAATIDSAAKRLYVTDNNSSDISIFSTTRGHALLGKIHTGVEGNYTSLAVDPIAQRLYLVFDSWDFGGAGILAISTVPPYKMLEVPNNSGLNVAVAVAAGKLYVVEYYMETPLGYVDVYDTSSLKLTATIGPFFQPYLPIGIAVDAPAQRLYVLESGNYFNSVDVYRLDTGLSFLEAFNATVNGSRIEIAPDIP